MCIARVQGAGTQYLWTDTHQSCPAYPNCLRRASLKGLQVCREHAVWPCHRRLARCSCSRLASLLHAGSFRSLLRAGHDVGCVVCCRAVVVRTGALTWHKLWKHPWWDHQQQVCLCARAANPCFGSSSSSLATVINSSSNSGNSVPDACSSHASTHVHPCTRATAFMLSNRRSQHLDWLAPGCNTLALSALLCMCRMTYHQPVDVCMCCQVAPWISRRCVCCLARHAGWYMLMRCC